MALLIKTLDARTITASGNTILYTVPTAKSAMVSSVRLVNAQTSGATPALNLYVKPSGASTFARRIYKKDFSIPFKEDVVIEDPVTLGQGDQVQIDSVTPPTLDCVINGFERDV